MVEDHIQVHLDAPLVEGLDQLFQLVALPVVLGGGGVAGVGGEKAHRAVPPIIIQGIAVVLPVVLHLVELENGHQLHGVDPQGLQIGYLLLQPGEGPRVGCAGGCVLGKAPDVELVDDQVLHGDQGLLAVTPVEVVLHHPGLVVLAPGGGVPPLALPGHRLGVGVQQIPGLVKNHPLPGVVGAVHPVGVLKLLNVQLEHDHGVDVSNAVVLGEGEDGKGLVLRPVEQQQLDGGGVVGVDGKIHAAGDGGGSVDVVKAGADVKAGDLVQGDQVDGVGKGQRDVVLNGMRHRVAPPLI